MGSFRFLSSVVLVLAACGSEPPTAGFEVELALSPEAGAQCGSGVETLTNVVGGCLELEVCVRDDGATTCEPVRLTASQDYMVEPGSIFLPIQTNKLFSLAAELGTGEKNLELRAVAYDASGNPVAEGRRFGVLRSEFEGDSPVRLRLYRYGRASCAGGQVGRENTTAVARALHAATLLPNGDVLVYGGVRDRAAARPMGMDWEGAPLQRQVEVYHADEERFEVLEGEVARIMFAPVLLTTDAAAPYYDIYLAGGFTVISTGSVVRFDDLQSSTVYGAPVLPADGIEVVPDQILRYHPAERRVEVIAVDEPLPMAGASVADAPPGADVVPILLGASMPRQSDEWVFATATHWLTRSAGTTSDSVLTNAERYGGTITLLASGNAFIWGGNIAQASPTEIEMTAGQIVTPGRTQAGVPGGGTTVGVPDPVVFHTATRLGAGDDVLVAGGLRVGCAADMTCLGGQGVTTMFAPSPLTLFHVSGMGVASTESISPGAYTPSVFHHATRLPDGSALLTGGAIRDGRLVSTNQAVRVTTTGVTPPTPAFMGALKFPRWGHQVTRLDSCPPGAAGCTDARYLVTGGFASAGDAVTPRFEAIGEAEILYLRDASEQPSVTFEPGTCSVISSTDGGAIVDGGGTDGGSTMSVDAGVPADAGLDAGM
jgi:hypothetical protein